MEIQIITEGFANNKEILNELGNIDLIELLYEVGNSIIDEARSNLQNNTNIDSGTLLASINILTEGTDFITLGSNEPYAGYIEYGRGEVRPLKPDGWLHWVDKVTHEDVFAKFAKATDPMPFLEPAVIIHTDMFSNLYKEQTDEMARRKGLLT